MYLIHMTHTHTHISPGPSNVPEICVQFHLKLKFRCCQNENALFWMPGRVPLTKRLEIGVQKVHKMHTNPKKGINAVDLKVLRMNLHIFGANVLKFQDCAEIC